MIATSGLVEGEGSCSCTFVSSTPRRACLSSTPEIWYLSYTSNLKLIGAKKIAQYHHQTAMGLEVDALPSFWAPLNQGLFHRQGVLSDGNGDTGDPKQGYIGTPSNTLNKSWWHRHPLWAIGQKVVTHRKVNEFIHTLIKWGKTVLNAKGTPSS